MASIYQKWMYAWETRLTTRDTNRVVRPLEWGMEWARRWPLVNGNFPSSEEHFESYLHQLNDHIVAHSDEFFAYKTADDFRLEPVEPIGHTGDLYAQSTAIARKIRRSEEVRRRA